MRKGRGPGERTWCFVQVKGPSEVTAAEGMTNIWMDGVDRCVLLGGNIL